MTPTTATKKTAEKPKAHKAAKPTKPHVAKTVPAEVAEVKEVKKHAGRYVFSVGRRKTAVAKIKFWESATGDIVVNGKPFSQYFPTETLRQTANAPLAALGQADTVHFTALVQGGGKVSQAKAVSLALARALVTGDAARKTVLKKQGLMTRDSRKKERKKPGLKRARRAPQWQKR